MNQKTYKYKFSFVIPVYNVEKYLGETIESILSQTLSFEQNCEIILVNDGSPDNSEQVCLYYQEKFPNNIKYFKQKNQGPSVARNRGLKEVKGKYISLLDSDDKLSKNCLEKVLEFFEEHYDEIDVVSIKQLFFESREGEHPLNYKFNESRVVDLAKEFDCIQMSAASSFFKAEVFEIHSFDVEVGRYAEDAKLMGEILLDKQKYGVVVEPIYFYRKRSDQASSLDTTITDKFWYLETPTRAFGKLLEYAKNKYDQIPNFIQYMVMYDLQWRIKQPQQVALSENEVEKYKQTIYGLLGLIDDEVILSQRQIEAEYKAFILRKKHKDDLPSSIVDHKDLEPTVAQVEFINVYKDEIIIEGFYDGTFLGDSSFKIKADNDTYNVARVDRVHNHKTFLGDLVSDGNCFQASIRVHGDKRKIEFIVDNRRTVRVLPVRVHRFTYLNRVSNGAYRVSGKYIIRRKSTALEIVRNIKLRRVFYEFIYMLYLAKRLNLVFVRESIKKIKRTHHIDTLHWILVPPKNVITNICVVLLRLTYFAVKPFVKQPIWLVSDRLNAADDNGEVFFRHVMQRTNVNAKVYFVIDRKTNDFQRIRQYGKVVDYHGLKYKILFLLSSKVISSEATNWVINAFGRDVDSFVDLYHFDFVFLQHGVIRDDISAWLNRYNKNIKLFITSAKPEYKSIINGHYSYSEKEVKLTGLPRYDWLENDPQNKLIIAPTWRNNLVGPVNQSTGLRSYNKNFKKSEFYKFFQDLISNPKLLSMLRKHHMKGEFYLHPSFQRQIKDFMGNEEVDIKQMPHNYPKLKREGSLLITDYSSVALDFAYMKKPIIYTQFDVGTYYKLSTSQEGYLSYERDGLGPVVYDPALAVKLICETIEKGSRMEDKYRKRLKAFFNSFDKENSARVYQAILAMDKQE